MTGLEQLVLAALVHDLPPLTEKTGASVSADAQRVLDLARLDQPILVAMLDQAQGYAMPGDSSRQLVTTQPLTSIFSRIQLERRQEPQPQYCWFTPLPSTNSPQNGLFPKPASNVSRLATHVQELATELSWLGSEVDLTQFACVYQHLMALLQKYGWCLPSHNADVALFDHAKLTSAIAACLYHYHQDESSVDALQAGTNAQRFCLLVGDLSGIQDYIFDITSIGAGGIARRLRARSFYLSVLSDVLSHQIALRFDMPLGNVIMSSGGKFYILLPNRDDIDKEIHALRHEVDAWLREQFNGEIAINLAYVCFAGDQFQAGSQTQAGFGDVMTDLSLKLNREKRRRGQSVLVRTEDWDEAVFVINRDFWGVGACVSCGKFPGDREASLCEKCERDVQIGKRLPRTRYVAYYQHAADEDAIPMPMGCSARILARDELAQAGQPYLLTKLNDPEIHELASYPASFRYLANHVPLGDYGSQLSFEDIAKMAQGRPLLGYVKADVDYLGILFAQGLRRDQGGYDTAAHMAALSRELDLFFSGWIQHLLSQTEAYRSFYTIFSGGDDLFLVGPWDKAADLARKVRDELATFVAGNPDITLSAGVLFTKERYPISRAAQDAEEILELSKEREWTDAQGQQHKRNQLTLLGDTFTWDIAPQIFDEIEMLRKRSAHLTSAFLYDLVEYGRLYELWTREKQVEGLRYKALFAYNIARNLRKGDAALYRWADGLMQSLHGGEESLTMQHLGLIATYLLFSRRERRNGKD
jgi:CRISPR-associated protein Csm1